MRTATSKFVTVLDVFVVVGACICGAVTGLVAKNFIERINMNLKKVIIINEEDKQFNVYSTFYANNSFRLMKNWPHLMNQKKIKDTILL